MTLLGKLFRPWDISSEESTIKLEARSSKNSESVQNSEEINLNVRAHHRRCKFGGKRRETLRIPEKSPGEKVMPLGGPKARTNSSSSYPEDRKSVESSSSSSVSKLDVPVSGSIGGGKDDLWDPMSPTDFDYGLLYPFGCGSSSGGSPATDNIFMYPNTINELASLTRNELTAMGLLPPEPPSAHRLRRQRPKRFHCPHCQVAFSNNGQLRGHIRIHTGERPYLCEEEGCGKSFTRNEELTRHRRIHSGLRPFPCSYCGKKFGRKDHLKKHTRTHTRGLYHHHPGGLMIGYSPSPFQPFHTPLLSSPPPGFPLVQIPTTPSNPGIPNSNSVPDRKGLMMMSSTIPGLSNNNYPGILPPSSPTTPKTTTLFPSTTSSITNNNNPSIPPHLSLSSSSRMRSYPFHL